MMTIPDPPDNPGFAPPPPPPVPYTPGVAPDELFGFLPFPPPPAPPLVGVGPIGKSTWPPPPPANNPVGPTAAVHALLCGDGIAGSNTGAGKLGNALPDPPSPLFGC